MFRKIACVVLLTAAAAPALPARPGSTRASTTSASALHRASVPASWTRPEARRLVHGEIGLHRAERYAKSDGVVTRAERCRLERRADHHERAHLPPEARPPVPRRLKGTKGDAPLSLCPNGTVTFKGDRHLWPR